MLIVGYPLVDQANELKRDHLAFEQLEQELQTTRQRNVRLGRIESKLQEQKKTLVQQNVLPESVPSVRDEITEIIRRNGGSLRSLEIQDGNSRRWAIEADDPNSRRLPEIGMESDFILHSIPMTLSVSGSLSVVLEIARTITDHHWLLNIETLDLKPITQDEKVISLEITAVFFGLQYAPEPEADLLTSI